MAATIICPRIWLPSTTGRRQSARGTLTYRPSPAGRTSIMSIRSAASPQFGNRTSGPSWSGSASAGSVPLTRPSRMRSGSKATWPSSSPDRTPLRRRRSSSESRHTSATGNQRIGARSAPSSRIAAVESATSSSPRHARARYAHTTNDIVRSSHSRPTSSSESRSRIAAHDRVAMARNIASASADRSPVANAQPIVVIIGPCSWPSR